MSSYEQDNEVYETLKKGVIDVVSKIQSLIPESVQYDQVISQNDPNVLLSRMQELKGKSIKQALQHCVDNLHGVADYLSLGAVTCLLAKYTYEQNVNKDYLTIIKTITGVFDENSLGQQVIVLMKLIGQVKDQVSVVHDQVAPKLNDLVQQRDETEVEQFDAAAEIERKREQQRKLDEKNLQEMKRRQEELRKKQQSQREQRIQERQELNDSEGSSEDEQQSQYNDQSQTIDEDDERNGNGLNRIKLVSKTITNVVKNKLNQQYQQTKDKTKKEILSELQGGSLMDSLKSKLIEVLKKQELNFNIATVIESLLGGSKQGGGKISAEQLKRVQAQKDILQDILGGVMSIMKKDPRINEIFQKSIQQRN